MSQNPNFPENLSIEPSEGSYKDYLSSKLEDMSSFGFSTQQHAINLYGIAGRVWEASYPLIEYLCNPWNRQFNPALLPEKSQQGNALTIIELGSGTGIVASTLRRYTLRTNQDLLIATDLPEVCSMLEKNLEEHLPELSHRTTLVRSLAWGSFEDAVRIASELENFHHGTEPRYLTHIICSDLVYFPELLGPLLRTLIQLTQSPFVSSPSGTPTVVVSYKVRSLTKEIPFWSAFGLWFTFEPVCVRENASNEDSSPQEFVRFGSSLDDLTFVFVARRKVASLDWAVPASDRDLLDGVGALGTNEGKGDDFFESLLLMMMLNE